MLLILLYIVYSLLGMAVWYCHRGGFKLQNIEKTATGQTTSFGFILWRPQSEQQASGLSCGDHRANNKLRVYPVATTERTTSLGFILWRPQSKQQASGLRWGGFFAVFISNITLINLFS